MKAILTNRPLQLTLLGLCCVALLATGHTAGALGVLAFAGTIEDGSLQFDGAVGSSSFAAITVSRVSTNIIDLVNARDLGVGDQEGATPKLLILVGTAFAAAGAGTLEIQFQGAPDDGTGAPGTWTTYASSGALSLAQLAAGNKLFPIDVPHRAPGAALPRFYRLNYVVATGPMTAGTIHSAIVLTRQDSTQYPPGVVVSN